MEKAIFGSFTFRLALFPPGTIGVYGRFIEMGRRTAAAFCYPQSDPLWGRQKLVDLAGIEPASSIYLSDGTTSVALFFAGAGVGVTKV